MWKLKIAKGQDGPYMYSTNNYVGRQTWEFDPNAGMIEEHAEIEEARQHFWKVIKLSPIVIFFGECRSITNFIFFSLFLYCKIDF